MGRSLESRIKPFRRRQWLELPNDLKSILEKSIFTITGWDALSEEMRVSVARQWDMQHPVKVGRTERRDSNRALDRGFNEVALREAYLQSKRLNSSKRRLSTQKISDAEIIQLMREGLRCSEAHRRVQKNGVSISVQGFRKRWNALAKKQPSELDQEG